MKKGFVCMVVLSMILCSFSLSSCISEDNSNSTNNDNTSNVGNSVDDGNENSSDISTKKSLKVTDFSIEDFVWETIPSKYNGVDCYTFSLVNNSAYDIIGVCFTYKVKNNVADNELVVFDEFMKAHDGYIKENDSPRNVTLHGSKDSLVSKGEQLTGLRFTVGYKDWSWYDYPTDEQFKLMEPEELEIGVIGEDNTFYIAYYDFEDDEWVLDENTVPADTWSKTEISEQICKPIEKHHIVVTDEEERFKVYSYGVTRDNYGQYIESIKNLGYEEESYSSAFFKGKSTDGNIIELWYYADEERLSISIDKNG